MQESPAAAQALDVLTLLARAGGPLPASLIAAELGLPRSTAYRLLATLAGRGFVTHVAEEGRFGLGLAAYELGSAYQRQGPLQRAARPVLSRLVDVTTHNAHLAAMHGRDVLYLIEERAPGRSSLVTDVGVRLPAEATASGLAMLAALPRPQFRAVYPAGTAMVQRDGRGPSSMKELRELLTQTRSRGYALEEGSVTEGFSSVAVAVLDHTGHPVAGVAVTYPSADVTEPAREAIVVAVRRASAAISARIGASARG